jgi:hypothetical protein
MAGGRSGTIPPGSRDPWEWEEIALDPASPGPVAVLAVA